MKNLLILFIFSGFLFSVSTVNAQNFDSAVGLRLGYPLSISYKKFINDSHALEFMAGTRGNNTLLLGNSFRYRWFNVGGAYLVHAPLDMGDFGGLDWYFGGGASVNFWTYNYETDNANISFGIQGYLGLSYTFDDAPVNISLDWVPSLFIGRTAFSGFGGGYGSLAVRYVLD